MHRVMIQPASYDNCREAVDRAFHLFPLELKGRKILVKPNVLRVSEAEQGIVTHPSVLSAVVEKLKTMNPESIVVGDNPGLTNYGANQKSFEQTGLLEAAGGCYQNIGEYATEVDFIPGFLDKLSISQAVLEADVIISLPKFKTHGLTIISLG